MAVYYNENDRHAADWLRNLIAAGELPEGDVDTRSITEISTYTLKGYTQCHFFAGIGGWPLALRMAGWPDDAPVWTSSAPCQPFSTAGRRKGVLDERHLWPVQQRLVDICKPPTLFGEQVSQAITDGWLDQVFNGMERQGYACGASVLPAVSANGSHVGPRCYFVCALPAHGDRSVGPRTCLPIGGARPEWPRGPEDLRAVVDAPMQPGERHPQPIIRLGHDGLPARLVKARTKHAGNAIFPPLAAHFIAAAMEAGL